MLENVTLGRITACRKALRSAHSPRIPRLWQTSSSDTTISGTVPIVSTRKSLWASLACNRRDETTFDEWEIMGGWYGRRIYSIYSESWSWWLMNNSDIVMWLLAWFGMVEWKCSSWEQPHNHVPMWSCDMRTAYGGTTHVQAISNIPIVTVPPAYQHHPNLPTCSSGIWAKTC